MDSEDRFGLVVIIIVFAFLAFIFADFLFAHHATQEATIIALASEPEGGLSGGTTHIAILNVKGRRVVVYVRHATDFYSFLEGQQVTLHQKRGRFTGLYIKDWIE